MLINRVIENPEHWDVRVVVYSPYMEVKVVGNCSLVAVNEPVAHAVELIPKVGCDHGNILVLQSSQLLEVTLRPSIHNNRAVTLIAEKNGKLIHSILLAYKLHNKVALVLRMPFEPLRLLLEVAKLAVFLF
jgi:hypothetical protein